MTNGLNRRLFLGALGGTAALGALSPRAALAQGVNLDMATMNIGSAWYQYGVLFSQYMQRALPTGSIVNVRDFAGGDGNLRLIEADDRVQIGLTFGANVAWGRRGMTEISDASADQVRLIAGAIDQYYVGMMALGSIGVHTISEALEAERGLHIATTAPGSSGDIGATLMLQAHDVDEATLESWGGSISRVSLQAASENMATGRADIWVNMMVAGHPRATELAHGNDLRFLGLSDAALERVRDFGFTPAELPAGAFPGHDEGVMLAGTNTIMIVHESMDDDTAYTITKAMIDNHEAIMAENASLRDWDLERGTDVELAGGAPLHPGAEAAYRDAGVI